MFGKKPTQTSGARKNRRPADHSVIPNPSSGARPAPQPHARSPLLVVDPRLAAADDEGPHRQVGDRSAVRRREVLDHVHGERGLMVVVAAHGQAFDLEAPAAGTDVLPPAHGGEGVLLRLGEDLSHPPAGKGRCHRGGGGRSPHIRGRTRRQTGESQGADPLP